MARAEGRGWRGGRRKRRRRAVRRSARKSPRSGRKNHGGSVVGRITRVEKNRRGMKDNWKKSKFAVGLV
jgi:hypothetical protein